MRCLGIEDQFLDIFDITKSNYIPKPMKSSLNKLIKQYELNPSETAYFDDLEKNLMSASLKGLLPYIFQRNQVVNLNLTLILDLKL